jgi:adenylate cyclase
VALGERLTPLGVEIERKFMAPGVPEGLDRCRSEDIEQGYLAVGPDAEVRLRRIGEERVLTVKRGAGAQRLEEEVEITEAQFQALWPLIEGQRLSKRRFYVPLDGLVAEVDVYGGELDGLITAEVEFESSDQSDGFHPPPWLGTEVTEDPRFANQALATAAGPPEAAA